MKTKSKWKSKTFLTGVGTAALGLLIALGLLPESVNSEAVIGTAVTVIGAVVAVFRKQATTVIE